ncbi:MAG TPA: hypothetical protein PKD00_00505 [Burkholderiales bacterium]|nr:hypothetical protein [Burkholderiales bacterium]
MLNKVEIKVTAEKFADKILTDQYMFRLIARKLIEEMPIEELAKVFKFTKIDPNTPENKAKLSDYNTSQAERAWLESLNSEGLILFKVEIVTEDMKMDKETYNNIKKAYHKALEKGEISFIYAGQELLVSYAKYLLEYFEMTLKIKT